ncbi:tRNA 2-selenouridine(34) synthase MnmH [Desulfurobacterium atlanticum]|uniref:tRNA 2-selenouridine synthase n=1 Tax=Desulfurobacterium atlanticum TaxID=240169 RepID=A0A238XTJ8_9BACT|nr:tRNA 2-selenouridine(34) synthase MnmH [Desulfurobacterium atlanticum]SNR62237.1 tRNA 2-selenouridine synthase [Desulfurobacterium atlanticum]
MNVPEIDVKKALNGNFTFVDVRTAEEFKNFHIPKAYNVPLFNKEEKEFISKIYREKGEKEARFEAVKVVSPKIYSIVERVDEIKKRHENVAVYCWRGGLRSLAVTSFCQLAGVFVFRLKGGYRAFRYFILADMEKLLSDKRVYVLYGPTGCGKTAVLRYLKAKNFPVIDLEGLAGHRGSVFGSIGMKQPSQKMFDALLWCQLRRFKNSPFIIVEGESKKIGNLYLPDCLFNKMKEDFKIAVSVPLEERVRFSLKEYGVGKFESSVYLDALSKIKRYLSPEVYKELESGIRCEDYPSVVRNLIIFYYDKLYKRSMPGKFDFEIKASSVEELKVKLEKFFLYLKDSE